MSTVIERVCVRSVILIGDFSVCTPYVQSFNVKKQRGQISSFDASVKVLNEAINNNNLTGGCVKIYAGTSSGNLGDNWRDRLGVPGGLPIIFTGIIKSAKINPCFDDPKYVVLSISGTDVLGLLEGKKFTRRCRSTISSWVGITGSTPGLKSDKLAFQQIPRFEVNAGKTQADSPLVAAPPTGSGQGGSSTAQKSDIKSEIKFDISQVTDDKTKTT